MRSRQVIQLENALQQLAADLIAANEMIRLTNRRIDQLERKLSESKETIHHGEGKN